MNYNLHVEGAPQEFEFDNFRVMSEGLNPLSNMRCRVSFHDTRMEHRVVSLACLSDDLRNDIWYSPADIETMRAEARDLCRYVRVNPNACPEEHTRGLEMRISLERQCRKQLTVQGVVEAQRRCRDPSFLACIAQKCSALSKNMALAQAQRDYCTVYQPSMSDMIPLPSMDMNISVPPGCSLSAAVALPTNQQQVQDSQFCGDINQLPLLEPIPLILPDNPLVQPDPLALDGGTLDIDEGNKRSFHGIFDDEEDRAVRQRLENFQAA